MAPRFLLTAELHRKLSRVDMNMPESPFVGLAHGVTDAYIVE